MVQIVKSARQAGISDVADMKVRATVEGIIKAVREGGDTVVQEFRASIAAQAS